MMKEPKLFPLHYYCSDKYGWANNPELANLIWRRIRLTVAPELVWYAVDMIITSYTTITLRVYDMACNVSGGIGKKILTHEVSADTLTDMETTLLKAEIGKAQLQYAERELNRILEEQRMLRVELYRQELFGE